MRVVVIGGGRVGFYLAKTLINSHHSVTLVDKDKARCMTLQNSLGEIVVWGSGTKVEILQEAGCQAADAVVLATREDDDNLVMAQVVQKHFTVPKVIARINNPANERIFREVGIKNTVSSITMIAELLERDSLVKETSKVLNAQPHDIYVRHSIITRTSEAVDRKISDIPIPKGCLITAIIRGTGVFIPDGETILREGDRILLLASRSEDYEDLVFLGEESKLSPCR